MNFVPPEMVSKLRPLIQQEINLMATAADWARKAALKAHICCLHGEKRRLRYIYRKATNIVDMMEHSPIDMLKIVDLKAETGTSDVSGMTNCETTMQGMIKKLWIIYDSAHQIANDLVIAKGRCYAEELYDFCTCVWVIIGELQKAYDEYEMADWEYHHVSRYQVSYYNVHDEYEKKEECQGYSDHKDI